MSSSNQRRQVFIQRAFQGRFVLWMFAILILFALFSSGVLYLLMGSDLENETRSAHVRVVEVWQKLGLSILVGSVVAAIVSGVAMAFVVVYITHKIAGPMYRFQYLFREIGRGNLELSTHLREHDQLQEMADSIKDMIEQLRRRKERQLGALAELRSALEGAGLDSAAQTELIARLDALEQSLGVE